MKPHLAIYRMFTAKVAELGFAHSRTAWWQRQHDFLLQGIHLHKFSFTASFRVHAAIHLAEVERDSPSLNGMYSYDGWYEAGDRSVLRRANRPLARRYTFDFTESAASWQPCADELFAYTRDVLIPWFDRWASIERLLTDSHSPLTATQRTLLTRA